MQANQTQTLSYTITLPTAFTVTSVSIDITRPDGVSILNQVATVSPPNTSATTQKVTFVYTPTLGGLWKVVWKPVISGQSYQYPVLFWVVWTEIYDTVRNMLGSGVAGVADTILDRQFRNIDVEFHSNIVAIPPYYKMTSSYADCYDSGMALLLASKVRPFLGGKRPTGEVSLFKKGTTTIQYTAGSPRATETLEDRWEEDGMNLLAACIPEIAAFLASDRSGDETMTRGEVAETCYVF